MVFLVAMAMVEVDHMIQAKSQILVIPLQVRAIRTSIQTRAATHPMTQINMRTQISSVTLTMTGETTLTSHLTNRTIILIIVTRPPKAETTVERISMMATMVRTIKGAMAVIIINRNLTILIIIQVLLD